MRRAYIINVIVATILFVFIVLSCSKKEDSSYNLRVIMVKENFTDPYKQHENIVVDDYIPYYY